MKLSFAARRRLTGIGLRRLNFPVEIVSCAERQRKALPRRLIVGQDGRFF
jgi:hypothetical protein